LEFELQLNHFTPYLEIKKQVERQIQVLGSRTANAQKADYLDRHPIIDVAKVREVVNE
jgi:hypothetical protein